MLSPMMTARSLALPAVVLLAVMAPGAAAPSPPAASGDVVMCAGEPATIVGTSGDDRLRGTDGRDVVAARGGDDVVRGLSGDDVACGGRGADRLVEDPDAADVSRRTTIVHGDAGPDRLLLTFGQGHGGDGDDVIIAGDGTRQGLDGDDGDDLIRGGAGRDFPVGGLGDDRLYGGPGPDYLRGEQGADLVVGGPGNDSADGGRDRPDTCHAELESGCEQ